MEEIIIIKWEDNIDIPLNFFLDDIIVSKINCVCIEDEFWNTKYVFDWYSKEEREEILLTLTNFRDNMFRFLSKDWKNL